MTRTPTQNVDTILLFFGCNKPNHIDNNFKIFKILKNKSIFLRLLKTGIISQRVDRLNKKHFWNVRFYNHLT